MGYGVGQTTGQTGVGQVPFQAPNGNFGVPEGMGGGLPAQGGMPVQGDVYNRPQIMSGTPLPSSQMQQQANQIQQQVNAYRATNPIAQQIEQIRNQVIQSGGIPTPQQEQQMRALNQQINSDPQMIQFANQMQSLQAPNLQGVGMGSMQGQPMTPQRLQQIMRPQRQRPDFFNAPFSMQGLGSLMRRSRGRR